MPVDLKFSENERYLIYTFQEPLQMDELMEAYHQEKLCRDSVDHTVHSIVDMSHLRRIPTNWLTAKAGPGLTHPRSGYILFVGISMGIKVIIQTIMKIARYDRMKFFTTRAEAEAYLQELVARDLEAVSRNGA